MQKLLKAFVALAALFTVGLTHAATWSDPIVLTGGESAALATSQCTNLTIAVGFVVTAAPTTAENIIKFDYYNSNTIVAQKPYNFSVASKTDGNFRFGVHTTTGYDNINLAPGHHIIFIHAWRDGSTQRLQVSVDGQAYQGALQYSNSMTNAFNALHYTVPATLNPAISGMQISVCEGAVTADECLDRYNDLHAYTRTLSDATANWSVPTETTGDVTTSVWGTPRGPLLSAAVAEPPAGCSAVLTTTAGVDTTLTMNAAATLGALIVDGEGSVVIDATETNPMTAATARVMGGTLDATNANVAISTLTIADGATAKVSTETHLSDGAGVGGPGTLEIVGPTGDGAAVVDFTMVNYGFPQPKIKLTSGTFRMLAGEEAMITSIADDATLQIVLEEHQLNITGYTVADSIPETVKPVFLNEDGEEIAADRISADGHSVSTTGNTWTPTVANADGNYDWSEAQNWSAGAVPATGADGVVRVGSDQNVTLQLPASAVSLASLDIKVANGSSLTIAANGSNTLTITGAYGLTTRGNVTIAPVIAGAGPITATSGTLTLSAANTYTGGTQIAAGATVVAANKQGLGNGAVTGKGSVEVTGNYANNTAVLSNEANLALTNVAWTGNLILKTTGKGAQYNLNNLGNDSSTITFEGASGFLEGAPTATIALVNGGFTNLNGSSSNTGSRTFPKMTGNGTLAGCSGYYRLIITPDASEFTGSVDATQRLAFVVGDSAHGYDATAHTSKIFIAEGYTATVAEGATWKVASGKPITVSGTLNVQGTLQGVLTFTGDNAVVNREIAEGQTVTDTYTLSGTQGTFNKTGAGTLKLNSIPAAFTTAINVKEGTLVLPSGAESKVTSVAEGAKVQINLTAADYANGYTAQLPTGSTVEFFTSGGVRLTKGVDGLTYTPPEPDWTTASAPLAVWTNFTGADAEGGLAPQFFTSVDGVDGSANHFYARGGTINSDGTLNTGTGLAPKIAHVMGSIGYNAKHATVVVAVETALDAATALNKPFISFSSDNNTNWGCALTALDTSAGTASIKGVWQGGIWNNNANTAVAANALATAGSGVAYVAFTIAAPGANNSAVAVMTDANPTLTWRAWNGLAGGTMNLNNITFGNYHDVATGGMDMKIKGVALFAGCPTQEEVISLFNPHLSDVYTLRWPCNQQQFHNGDWTREYAQIQPYTFFPSTEGQPEGVVYAGSQDGTTAWRIFASSMNNDAHHPYTAPGKTIRLVKDTSTEEVDDTSGHVIFSFSPVTFRTIIVEPEAMHYSFVQSVAGRNLEIGDKLSHTATSDSVIHENFSVTFDSTTFCGPATLTIDDGKTFSINGNTVIENNDHASLTVKGGGTLAAFNNFTANRPLTIDEGTTVNVAGNFSGAGAVTINSGALIVSGTYSGTGALTVKAGASLTVDSLDLEGANITVENGATLAVRNRLTLGGDSTRSITLTQLPATIDLSRVGQYPSGTYTPFTFPADFTPDWTTTNITRPDVPDWVTTVTDSGNLVITVERPEVRNFIVMPMGDSITEGSMDGSSYRRALVKQMKGVGFEPRTTGARPYKHANIDDEACWFHTGLYSQRLRMAMGQKRAGYLQGYENWLDQAGYPDAITIMIGTNDFQDPVDDVFRDWKILIKKMAEKRPNTYIIVAPILDVRNDYSSSNKTTFRNFYPAYNEKIKSLFDLTEKTVIVDGAEVKCITGVLNAAGKEVFGENARIRMASMFDSIPKEQAANANPSYYYDTVHPSQAGYNRMARVWLEALKGVADMEHGGLLDDDAIIDAFQTGGAMNKVTAVFNHQVYESEMADVTVLVGGTEVNVTARTLTADGRRVTLTLETPLEKDQVVTLKKGDITRDFNAIGATLEDRVDAAQREGFVLAKWKDLPNQGHYNTSALRTAAFEMSSELSETTTFDRMGYYVTLARPDGDLRYVWVAMDKPAAYTTLANLGIPDASLRTHVQNLRVSSNVKDIDTVAEDGVEGIFLATPNDLTATHAETAHPAAVADNVFDWNCTPGSTANGYGALQLFRVYPQATGRPEGGMPAATLFSYTHFTLTSGNDEIVLGDLSNHRQYEGEDQTTSMTSVYTSGYSTLNASAYEVKRIEIWVRPMTERTWAGATTGNWDTTTTDVWTPATAFADGDAVTFSTLNDSATEATVTLPAAVKPSAMNVTANTFAFTGAPITTSALTIAAGATMKTDSDLTVITGAVNGTLVLNSGATFTNAGAASAVTIPATGVIAVESGEATLAGEAIKVTGGTTAQLRVAEGATLNVNTTAFYIPGNTTIKKTGAGLMNFKASLGSDVNSWGTLDVAEGTLHAGGLEGETVHNMSLAMTVEAGAKFTFSGNVSKGGMPITIYGSVTGTGSFYGGNNNGDIIFKSGSTLEAPQKGETLSMYVRVNNSGEGITLEGGANLHLHGGVIDLPYGYMKTGTGPINITFPVGAEVAKGEDYLFLTLGSGVTFTATDFALPEGHTLRQDGTNVYITNPFVIEKPTGADEGAAWTPEATSAIVKAVQALEATTPDTSITRVTEVSVVTKGGTVTKTTMDDVEGVLALFTNVATAEAGDATNEAKVTVTYDFGIERLVVRKEIVDGTATPYVYICAKVKGPADTTDFAADTAVDVLLEGTALADGVEEAQPADITTSGAGIKWIKVPYATFQKGSGKSTTHHIKVRARR